MPVNNFEFEKADGIISSIKGQSVGRDPISAAGIFNFVSIAQKGFGYEPEEVEMFIVHEDQGTLDKTWQEIFDAMKAEKIVIITTCSDELPLNSAATCDFVMVASYDPGDEPPCLIRVADPGHWYIAAALDAYPEYAD